MPKSAKITQHLEYRMRATLQDGRQLVGTFKAFDKHMNVILCDCDEFRKVKSKGSREEKEEKRSLGFVLIRGEQLVSLNVDGPPPTEDSTKTPVLPGTGATGIGQAVGRGMPAFTTVAAPPPGLTGPPTWGAGPPGSMMQPRPMLAGMPPGVPGIPPPPFGAPPLPQGGRGFPPFANQ
uniref:Sm protein B n=1 Tax=Schmidtea mediterranea TaxID=79327 RepID=D4P380_SCHMD|nr:small ribonucleoprotein SmB [Schmidtea mediterranea]